MHQRLQKYVTYNTFAELLLVIPDINACACIFYLHQPCQPVWSTFHILNSGSVYQNEISLKPGNHENIRCHKIYIKWINLQIKSNIFTISYYFKSAIRLFTIYLDFYYMRGKIIEKTEWQARCIYLLYRQDSPNWWGGNQ